ncbi:hypothetical protein [Nostoc sp.]
MSIPLNHPLLLHIEVSDDLDNTNDDGVVLWEVLTVNSSRPW